MWSLSVVNIVLATVLLVSSVAAIPILPFNETRADEASYRLPNNTRPVTYDIRLTTNIHRQDLKFTGVAIIDIEVLQSTSSIYLHTRQLTINSGSLVLAWAQSQQYDISFSYDSVTEILRVDALGILLPGGIYRLTLNYEGTIRTDGGGFYMQSYANPLGERVYLATTQFESTNARHGFPCYDEPQIKSIFKITITHGSNYNAISNMPIMKVTDKYLATTQFETSEARHGFPCYDEPALKAVFKISITHHSTYEAISNMPVLGEIVDNNDGSSTTSFEPTTLMSTYLVAYTVSDYVYTEKKDRVDHRVYSKPNFNEQHKFALDTSVAVLNSLEDYTGVKYPLAKLDNVAIPAKGGAMENWGLVTYGEQYILLNENETTTSSKTTIATIFAHELAHQWFGNLVSPKWWTYTWLNEGFASLYEYYTVNEVYPDWDIMQAFITGYLRNSLISDASANARPMTHYIESPAAVAGVFNYVSYGKSASVLKMFQNAFTDATFRKALTKYLYKMRYVSAVEEDLFDAFKEATFEDGTFNEAVDLDSFFKSWTNQGGYPLITVTRNYDQGSFIIKQQPYDGTNNPAISDRRSFWVPYNFATAKNADFSSTAMTGYIRPNTESVTVQQGSQTWSKDDWIILNKQATSFYRVNYDAQNWQLIVNGLQTDYKKIHTHNRAMLIEDVYRFWLAGFQEYQLLFDLKSYLKNEDQYAPWVVANTIFTSLESYLHGDSEYRTYRFFVKKMTENYFKILGVNERSNDAHLTKMIRASIITLACRGNNADCRDAANKKLRLFTEDNTKIEVNLRGTIMCTGMMSGKQADMNFMLQTLKLIEVQATRNQILSGLGCMRATNLITAYLNSTLDPTAFYSSSERLNVLGYTVAGSTNGVKAAINFLSANHAEYSKLPSTSNTVLAGLRSIAARIYSEELSKLFESLLAKLDSGVVEGVGASELRSLRSTVTNNLQWTEANRKPIIAAMTKFYEDNDGAKEEEDDDEEDDDEDEDEDDGAATIAVSTGVLIVVSIKIALSLFLM